MSNLIQTLTRDWPSLIKTGRPPIPPIVGARGPRPEFVFWWYALRMRTEPCTTGLFRWPPQVANRDLTLAHIDGDDGFHLAGVAILTTTETPEYAAHNATVWAKGLSRTRSQEDVCNRVSIGNLALKLGLNAVRSHVVEQVAR